MQYVCGDHTIALHNVLGQAFLHAATGDMDETTTASMQGGRQQGPLHAFQCTEPSPNTTLEHGQSQQRPIVEAVRE